MIFKYSALSFFAFFIFAFLKPIPLLANSPYFQDEFNQERAANTLDTSRWNLYPNSNETRIQESGGSVQLSSNSSSIFPYVLSKTNPFPTSGDFILEFGIQYTSVVQRGNGLVVSLTPPANNTNEVNKDRPEVYFFGVWQDTDKGFNVTYNGFCAFGLPCTQPGINIYNTSAPNLSYHTIRLVYSNSVYTAFVDGNKMFASPSTTNRPQAIWFGNPANQYANASWFSFKIDYVRVTAQPKPFLDLPWDYKTKGLSFNNAALSINSFFDHQYPLLSRGLDLNEPATASATIVNYLGETTTDSYSSHDGYDYGNSAQARLNDPVLAAADGWATYHYDKNTIGNAIFIDHGNGYQTRYFHMLNNSTIIKDGSSIWVNKGQEIGKVGSTGRSTGAHIHFMVVNDKDGDGNFDNNIPDGVTDPFGWQSKNPDPWENYTFNYLGQNRTGNKSYYLWKDNLDSMTQTLTPNGGTYTVGHYTVNFPQNATNKNIVIDTQSAPVAKPSSNLISLGPTLLIKATDLTGNAITQLQNLYNIFVDFSTLDLSRIKADTISLYSSLDGVIWTKENTSFPTQTSAQAQLGHLSYFALIGERKDTIAPTTTANLSGTSNQNSWFRSDVQLDLTAIDNNGGLGVDYTIYRINDGETQVYNSPLNFTNEGHYKIDFYSVDKDDNTEDSKSVEFDIDKTPPEAKIFLDDKTMDLSVTGIDTNKTTVTQSDYREKRKEKNEDDEKENNKKELGRYLITDQAGNTLEINIKNPESEKEDKSKSYSLTINSLKYNDQNVLSLPKNQYSVKYNVEKKKQIRLLQEFSLKEKTKIRIRYNEKLNKSEIFVINDEKEKLQETKDGMVILSINTKQGNLEYKY